MTPKHTHPFLQNSKSSTSLLTPDIIDIQGKLCLQEPERKEQREVERSETGTYRGRIHMHWGGCKTGESRAARLLRTQMLHFTVCFSISRGNIMLTSEGKSTEMENSCHRDLVELIYWICPLLLVLDGIHDYLITHLKASRIYGSESSTVKHVWRSTCKQSMKSQKIHVHHLYMSIWGICTWSFYNISM